MANTMAFALVGALVFTLTLVPVQASFWFKKARERKRPNKSVQLVPRPDATRAQLVPWAIRKLTMSDRHV